MNPIHSHLAVPILGCVVLAIAPAVEARAEGALSLTGEISADIAYRLRIDFATTVNDRTCQFDDYITGMWIPQVESRYEAPSVTGTEHVIQATLTPPSPNTACGWRPKVIHLCVGPRTGRDVDFSCRPLFLLTPFGETLPTRLTISCDIGRWLCVTPDGEDPALQVNSLEGATRLDLVVGIPNRDSGARHSRK
jgi:hypothetical protein